MDPRAADFRCPNSPIQRAARCNDSRLFGLGLSKSAAWAKGRRPQQTGFELGNRKAACRGRLFTLPCFQLGLGRQCQQCGLAAANRAAALWNAMASTEPSFQEHRMGRPVSGIGRAFQENHRREWARCRRSRQSAYGLLNSLPVRSRSWRTSTCSKPDRQTTEVLARYRPLKPTRYVYRGD